jgi:glutaredoxin-related protein
MQSLEFEALLEFLDKQYKIKKEEAVEFIENIELKKNVLDYRKSESFFEEAVKKDLHGMPILSTGGYNDHFLTFVSHVFNT